MKNIFIVLVFILLVVIGYLLFNQSGTTKNTDIQTKVAYSSESTTFVTNEDFFTVQYSEDYEFAKVLYGGETYELIRTSSGSGAKYESFEDSVVFWEHQGEAMIEIDGEKVIGGVKVSNDRK